MLEAQSKDNTINSILSEVVDFYSLKYGSQLVQVWLYCSKARGDYSNSSDMDITVVMDENTPII